MALSIIVESTEETLSLEDYLDHARTHVDARDPDSVCDSAPQLVRLANNRRFLSQRLARELGDWRSFQIGNSTTAQSFFLGGGKNFYLRANVWMPQDQVNLPAAMTNHLFSYQIPHDHNFSFLTVGYWGSGYNTTIFEYDRQAVVGLAGEQVRLRFLERTSLPQGKVMYYRACRDVHTQDPPAEFSISLNVLVGLSQQHEKEQLFFDLASSTITGWASARPASRRLLCRLAGYLGDPAAAGPLESVAARHPCPRTRAEAFESWAMLTPTACAEIWERALADPAELVRRTAATKLCARLGVRA
jgi:hypothetical protein